MREFTDGAGVRWVVWSTVPFASGVAGTMKDGWLTFESMLGRRRLVPAPKNWEDASVADLREYCQKAELIGRTPITGSWRIEPRDT